ncbi:MAG: hypothetical protein LQ340_005049 [Diploschistes diacapsis]|nr:MAG: hypothetical protein LQ340_005049 [Diploschistes diacapsis]
MIGCSIDPPKTTVPYEDDDDDDRIFDSTPTPTSVLWEFPPRLTLFSPSAGTASTAAPDVGPFSPPRTMPMRRQAYQQGLELLSHPFSSHSDSVGGDQSPFTTASYSTLSVAHCRMGGDHAMAERQARSAVVDVQAAAKAGIGNKKERKGLL